MRKEIGKKRVFWIEGLIYSQLVTCGALRSWDLINGVRDRYNEDKANGKGMPLPMEIRSVLVTLLDKGQVQRVSGRWAAVPRNDEDPR